MTTKPKNSLSLTLRTTLLFALIAALAISAVGFYLYYTMQKEMLRRADYQVVGRVQYFRHLLANDFPLAQLSRNPKMFENMLGNERDILQFSLAGQPPMIDVNPSRLALPALTPVDEGAPLALAAVHKMTAPDGTPVRFTSAAIRMRDGKVVNITAAHFMTGEAQMLRAFYVEILGAVVFAYILIAGLGYTVLRRGLRPLRNIAAEAAMIHPSSLSHRLSADRAPQELQQLIYSFNQMLDRLADGYQRLAQFSADLAHEIRTPVGALMGHCQVALYQPRSVEEYETLLAENIGELEHISRMVENILFLARASHVRSVINPAHLDIRVEIARIVDYFEGPADERGMSLRGEGDGLVYADAVLFQRALSNLVANAIRYGDEATPIALTTRHHPRGVDIQVLSQGKPIAPETCEKLFDRFYRADASRSDSGGSSGLGLSIVQAIMTLHHGSVSVDSAPTGRTCFTLHFPAQT